LGPLKKSPEGRRREEHERRKAESDDPLRQRALHAHEKVETFDASGFTKLLAFSAKWAREKGSESRSAAMIIPHWMFVPKDVCCLPKILLYAVDFVYTQIR